MNPAVNGADGFQLHIGNIHPRSAGRDVRLRDAVLVRCVRRLVRLADDGLRVPAGVLWSRDHFFLRGIGACIGDTRRAARSPLDRDDRCFST